MWLAELLWHARISPWLPLAEATDAELADALEWGRDDDARRGRGRAARARRLPPRGARAARAAARSSARVASATRTAPRTGATAASAGPASLLSRAGIGPSSGVPVGMAPRSPQLHHALRAFTLGAFAYLLRELDEAGDELPFAFEEHDRRDGPTLYEYRPLVGSFVEERADRASRPRRRADRARGAAARAGRCDLRPRPRRARAVRGRGALPHRPARPPDPRRRGVRRLRLGRRVASTAPTPSSSARSSASGARTPRSHRSSGITDRAAARALGRDRASGRSPTASSRATGPRPRALLPPDFGTRARPLLRGRVPRRPRRRRGRHRTHPPRSPTSSSAIRLATAAPLAAGPVLFETLDGRPYGIRPVLPIAATQPPGEPTRLDEFRGAARRRSFSSGSGSSTPTRTSPRRSTAGSSRCSSTSRSARSSCAPRSRRSRGRRGRCAPSILLETEPEARASAASRADARSRTARPAARGRRPRPSGAHSSRCSRTATGRRSSRELDRELLGVRAERPVRVAS